MSLDYIIWQSFSDILSAQIAKTFVTDLITREFSSTVLYFDISFDI